MKHASAAQKMHAKYPQNQGERFHVVSPHLHVPSRSEMEKQFMDFALKLRRGLHPNTHKLCKVRREVACMLGRRAYSRRSSSSELENVKCEKERDQISRLAKGGTALAGPRTLHEVDEWAAALHDRMPWMAKLTTRLMQHMRAHVSSGSKGLGLPPLLITGAPGNGKSSYARLLAALANAPAREIDVGSGSAGFRITGLERGWGTATKGIPVETILMKHVGNPVMIVNEVDKTQMVKSETGSVTGLTTALLQVLEVETARRFQCPATRVSFDLSRVSWILTANDLDLVPGPLRDRCTLFEMPEINPSVAEQMFDTLASGYDLIEPEALLMAREAVVATANGHHVSLRQIKRVLDCLIQDQAPLLH